MKPRLNLIKALHVLCIVCEISTAVGLAAVLLMAPFSAALVRDGRANFGLYAGHGSLNWNFRIRLPYGADSSIGNDGETGPSYGRVSFSPLRLHLEKGEGLIETRGSSDAAVAIDQIEGTMTLTRPELAAQAIAAARWPFVAGMLCTGGVGLAILDLLRRMLRSAIRLEVFTAANIRNVRAIGFLLIASGVLKLAAGSWLVSRMTEFMMQHVAGGNRALEALYQGDVSMMTGLLIVALAEVFRQGLTLKEDSQLTI
ncbi:MAG: DUF2975 domain-containing protein [Opitutaceae bacterium]|jgi:hypothetical protein